MTPALLTLALLAQPECRLSEDQARQLAPLILQAESRYQLPDGLLAAVVLAESGGRWQVSAPRHDRGRDHGPAQIHLGPATRPVHDPRTLAGNLLEGARLLARSRDLCLQHPRWKPCRNGGYWALYNANSERWPHRVQRIWERIIEHAATCRVA